MENSIHSLPPLKRFKLLQQQELPAKKRRESWDSSRLPSPTCSLPAKKRVWAPQHIISPQKPISPLDLNLEYKPSLEKKPFTSQTQPKFFAEFTVDSEEKEANEETQVANDSFKNEERKEEDNDGEDGIVCDICQSTDGDPSDPIVLCDGCDLMVHATCYGNPLIQGIPEGDWFCARCQVSSPSRTVVADEDDGGGCCCLCPVKGGAMKPTTDGRWSHIMCALLVPEVFFRDSKGREGIDCSRVPRRRWEEGCYVCNSASGCAIECSEPKCSLGFHVTCGLQEELCIEYREGRTGAVVAGFCKIHTELWKKQQQTGKFKIVARDEQRK